MARHLALPQRNLAMQVPCRISGSPYDYPVLRLHVAAIELQRFAPPYFGATILAPRSSLVRLRTDLQAPSLRVRRSAQRDSVNEHPKMATRARWNTSWRTAGLPVAVQPQAVHNLHTAPRVIIGIACVFVATAGRRSGVRSALRVANKGWNLGTNFCDWVLQGDRWMGHDPDRRDRLARDACRSGQQR